MASELALQLAAQAWCQDKTSSKIMDADLCEAFAVILDVWIDVAAQNDRNTAFYRGLLDDCAKHLGPDVYMADDGSIQDEPIRLKIPAMVKYLAEDIMV